MLKRVVIYWRDIPSAVIYKKGRAKGKVQLSQRFQEAIDRAAMRAGKGGTDAYIAEWRRAVSTSEEAGTLDDLARQCADHIEQSFTDVELTELIKAHGVATPQA